MTKKLSAVILAVILAASLFGCTKSKNADYDADKIADALSIGLEFGEQLEKSTTEIACSYYGIDSALCEKIAFYIGSGSTADEIAVFNCVDSSALEKVTDAVNSRIEYLRDGYSSYGPQEVPKINSAAVITRNNTVILCICENPENAESIVKTATEQ